MIRFQSAIIMGIFCFLSAIPMKAQELSPIERTSVLLQSKLENREAVIWFLFNDAFAVRTRNHLLIFDYFPYGEPPDTPSLANGFINPREISDLDVVVFVSHRDGDHYSSRIWEWKKEVRNITYVLGFDPARAQDDYIHPQPWNTRSIGDIEVVAIPALDSGEAFLVKVDGLVIYHSGDFAYWWKYYREAYKKGIDFFAEKIGYTDLLFTNWRVGPDRFTLEEGLWYADEKLSAKAIFPMHIMFADLEQIQELINVAEKREEAYKIANIKGRGDAFIYRGGQLEKL